MIRGKQKVKVNRLDLKSMGLLQSKRINISKIID